MLAVAAMVACSNEHTVEVAPQNNAIDFTTHVDKATRVATDITKDNIANFGVYASVTNAENASALILTNEEVTKSGDAWVYGDTQYWVPGNSYNFVAIAPYQAGTEAKWVYTPANGTAQNGAITFDNSAAAGEMDLVYAYAQRNEVAAGAQDKVGLTFNHLLSKVAFKLTNGFAAVNNITFEVYGIKINNAVAEAKVEVNAGAVQEWAKVDDTTFVREFGKQTAEDVRLASADAYTTEHYYLIPVAKEYKITFSIDVYQSGVKVATYNHDITTAINFEKGCNYSINATFTPENINPNAALDKIVFDVVKVEEWNDADVALEAKTVADATELATAVAAGGDIRLTQDIALEGEELNVADDKEVNVDLNGYTLTIGDVTTRAVDAIDPIKNYGKMTIANGKIVAGNAELTRRCIYNYGEMVIENMEFVQTYGAKGAAINNEGAMTIKSAVVNSVYYAIWNSGSNAILTVENGTFNCVGDNASWKPSNDSVAWCYAVTNRNGAKMIVNGGTFTGNHGVIAAYGGAEVTLNAGTYNCYATMSGVSDWVFYAYGAGSKLRYNAAKCTLIHATKSADACCTTENNGVVEEF